MKKEAFLFEPKQLDEDSRIMRALKEAVRTVSSVLIRRNWPILAGFGTLFILIILWKVFSGHNRFPRRESEFLSAEALDRRLERANQRLKANPDDVRTMVESGILLYQKGKDFYPDAINALDDAW